MLLSYPTWKPYWLWRVVGLTCSGLLYHSRTSEGDTYTFVSCLIPKFSTPHSFNILVFVAATYTIWMLSTSPKHRRLMADLSLYAIIVHRHHGLPVHATFPPQLHYYYFDYLHYSLLILMVEIAYVFAVFIASTRIFICPFI